MGSLFAVIFSMPVRCSNTEPRLPYQHQHINNLTWGAIGGQWEPTALVCQCNQPMPLCPINKKEPPSTGNVLNHSESLGTTNILL